MAFSSRSAPPCRRLLLLLALGGCAVGAAPGAEAQVVPRARAGRAVASASSGGPVATRVPRLRLVEMGSDGAVFEMEAAWRDGLADAVGRAGAGPAALVLSAVGGLLTTSEVVELPAAVAPAVEVLASDYDEVPFPSGLAGAEGFAELAGPVAEVVGVGLERRQPMGTLAVRLLAADAERGTLRRYRRVRVAVRFATAPMASATGAPNPHLAVTRSALAEGEWYKIPIAREGVYKLDRAYLEALGAIGERDVLDPSRLQVFHNGGHPLPALNSAPRPADLVESPVLVRDGGDGSFDGSDALYFFAEGPSGWNWRLFGSEWRWSHYVNPFTTRSYVFLRVDGASGRRVEPAAFPGWADAERLDALEGRLFTDPDLTTLEFTEGGSGLEWLGPELSASRRVLPAVLDTMPPALAAGVVRYRARVSDRPSPGPNLVFSSGGQTLRSVFVPAASSDVVATAREDGFEQGVGAGARLTLDLTLQGGGEGALAWPDYVEAVFPEAPRAHEGVFRFATPGGRAGRFEVALEGFAAEPEVWDVTEPGGYRRLGVRLDEGRWLVRVEATDSTRPREVVAFDPSGARVTAPEDGAALPNQNLHGIADYPDYVIVAPAAFRAPADELAAYRAQHDGLRPLVVNVEEVLNEFAGGTGDMRAVRDFLKFLFDRAPGEAELPRYALLLGDGHHDYRGITPEGRQNNWVPVYETQESFNRGTSYTSDDYFALLNDDEGVWTFGGSSSVSDERVDLGVGRIPARSAEEAGDVLAKLRRYEDPATYGAWRTRATFLADDNEPNSWDTDYHLQNAEQVAGVAEESAPGVDLNKVYMISYPRVVTAAGRRRPEATADALRAFEEGTLVWNYNGHGGPPSLADERLLTAEQINGLTNFDRLAIVNTATCSFGRFDLVREQSGAELLVLNPDGGAAASFTTTRLVYTSTEPTLNTGLNMRLVEYMLSRDSTTGRPLRLGDVYFYTKRTDVGAQGNNRKFSLLGDPAMRVGLPDRPVAIETVNGVPLPAGPLLDSTAVLPALRARERAVVTGRVLGLDGQPDPTFEGEVELVVYDAAREVTYTPVSRDDGVYVVRDERIYRGRASARGGAFRAEFIVPQDVSYSGEPARLVAYARPAGDGLDGSGFTERVVVAETAGAPLNDAQGPEVRLFLGDTTFVDGGLTGPEPTLVVRLRDESGINTVGSGVGHELLLVLDGDEGAAQEVGRFYEGDLDSYQSGTVRVPLPPQPEGAHRLRVTAWDVANNATTAELAYVVSGDESLVLRNVFNYPNPTPGRSQFTFEHNQPPGTPARVQLRLYTLAGRPVRTLDAEAALPGGALPAGLVQIPWDGLDEDLDPLATGIYLYRLRVEVDRADGSRDVAERIERLAVIR